MWTLAIEILKALFAGDFLRYWNEYKDKEAHNAENEVAAMSDTELDKRVQSDITRK